MAPVIATSLREYCIDKARECERHAASRTVQERDEWLALMDWTEHPDTLHSFDAAINNLRAVMEAMKKKHGTDDDTEFTREILWYVEHACDHVEDARYVITNLRREDSQS